MLAATSVTTKTTLEFTSRIMTEPELDDFYAWHRTPKNIRPIWSKAKGYGRAYKDADIKPTSITIINPPMGQRYWDVRLIVGSFGPIRDIYQPRYFGSTKPRGVIFVEMVNEEDARRLVEETNVFYDNEHVRIEYAGPRGRPGDFIGRAVAKAVAEVGVSPSQPIIVNINYGSGSAATTPKRYNFNVEAKEWTPEAPAPPSTPIMTAAAAEAPRTPERPKLAASEPPAAPIKVRRPPPGLDIIDGAQQRIAIGPIEGLGFNRRNLWGNKLGLNIPPFDLQPGQDDTIWPADPDYKPRSTGLNV